MPGCSDRYAPASLIEIRPSRWLAAWRAVLALVIAAAFFMVSPPAGLIALLIALWRRQRRGRPRRELLLVSAGDRFALPAERRFDLGLAPGSCAGPGWLDLVFDDRPPTRRMLLRDQLGRADWRRLRLAIDERR